MKKDIKSFADIQALVDKFYVTVQNDPLLGHIFNTRLEGRWEMHHRKLYRFWNTVLLRRPDYFGNPVPMHFDLNINSLHFQTWLHLWNRTVDENFEGEIAERAKFRAETMAAAFLSKIKRHERNSAQL